MRLSTTGAVGVGAAALMAVTAGARAQDAFAFTIDPSQSTISSTFTATAPFTGTFIGSYNADTNPGGTRTLPGAFGTCTPGNQPIGFTGSASTDGAPASNPTGTFTLQVDTVNNRAVLYALSIDLLGGTMPMVATSATMTYDPFHTCSPTGFFPSLTIPVPLGDATITRLTATQTCSPSSGTLTPLGPGQYTFSIPTMVTVDPGVTLNGMDQNTTPIQLMATVTGSVTVGNVAAMATAALSVNYHQEIMGPIVAADDQPFDIPNPLGGTVHLLLDLALTGVTVDLTANATLAANGTVTGTPCRADWNNDHTVNSQDFFDFLTSFFAGSADFNCSGATDSQDFFDFLTVYFVGC